MPVHEHIQNGANIVYSIPIAAGLLLAAKTLEQTVIVAENVGFSIHHKLRYGPDTDPNTWPSWEDAGIENPNIEVRQRQLHDMLNPSPERRREIEENMEMHRAMLEAWPELAERD